MQIKEEVEAKAKQKAASKRATIDNLTAKKRHEKELTIVIDGEEKTMLFRSIGMKAYDALLEEHPPTKDQRADGATYNGDTFGPALVAACCVEPDLDLETVNKIWDSDDWSRGDLSLLWDTAIQVNLEGFNVPFTGRG